MKVVSSEQREANLRLDFIIQEAMARLRLEEYAENEARTMEEVTSSRGRTSEEQLVVHSGPKEQHYRDGRAFRQTVRSLLGTNPSFEPSGVDGVSGGCIS